MDNKKLRIIVLAFLILLVSLWIFKSREDEIDFSLNIYHTTDLHSYFPRELVKYMDGINREESILVDGGDFWDTKTSMDKEWATGERILGLVENGSAFIGEELDDFGMGKAPIVDSLIDLKYDAVVLGNHELTTDFSRFMNLVDSFKEESTELLSANLFYDEKYTDFSGNVLEPYMIKEIEVQDDILKVGIIGATTNTINDVNELVDGKIIETDEINLDHNPEYKDRLYMTDLVEESIRISKELKEKEDPDIIILVAHTGEKPKNPKHSGNRIQELAEEVPYLDVIIGGHTHKFVDETIYKGPNNKELIYSQSGSHGKGIGNIKLDLKKNGDRWDIVNFKGENIKFSEDKEDERSSYYEEEMKIFTQEEYDELKKVNPNIYISKVIISDEELNFQDKTDEYEFKYVFENEGIYMHYMRFWDYDTFLEYSLKYE